MLMLIKKLITDFDLWKHRRLIKLFDRSRLFMFSRLLQIYAIARAVERNFPLLTAALRTYAPVHRRAEALLFAFLTNRTAQSDLLNA